MTRKGRRTVCAAFAVILHRGRVLIQRRPRRAFLGGYWEFPGGKREPGESWDACVRREVREELGVRIAGLVPVMTVTHAYRTRRLHAKVFRCRLAARSVPPRSSASVRWTYPAQLARVKFPEANRPILAWLRSPHALSMGRAHAIITEQGGTA